MSKTLCLSLPDSIWQKLVWINKPQEAIREATDFWLWAHEQSSQYQDDMAMQLLDEFYASRSPNKSLQETKKKQYFSRILAKKIDDGKTIKKTIYDYSASCECNETDQLLHSQLLELGINVSFEEKLILIDIKKIEKTPLFSEVNVTFFNNINELIYDADWWVYRVEFFKGK